VEVENIPSLRFHFLQVSLPRFIQTFFHNIDSLNKAGDVQV
jgi:hypothetical protein